MTTKPWAAALLFLLATASLWAQPAAGPYLVNAADTPAGHTLMLTGGGYDPATVQVILHLPGNNLSQRPDVPQQVADLALRFTGKPAPLPLTPPNVRTYTVKPVHATAQTVLAEYTPYRDQTYPPGFLALAWLKDGDRLSNPVAVNRPAAWFLLQPVSRPGEMNRLCGWNLVGDPYEKTYLYLRPAAGGKPVQLPLDGRHHEDGVAENFCFQFRVPADLAPGDYQVFLHNNSGAEFGFTGALPLQVVAEPDFPAVVFNGADEGLKGDSVTDNTKPLQALVDKAGQAGGGVVFLPPGAYRLSDTLQLRANVILRGAGRDATTVFFAPDPAIKPRAYWFISSRDVHHTGLEDLTVRTTPPMTLGLSYYNNAQPTNDSHVLRVRFVEGQVSVHYGVRMEIGDCRFERATLLVTNMKDSWIHDSEFTAGRLRGSPVVIWASENSTVEHNRSYDSNRGFVWQIAGVFGHYHNFIDANVTENTRMGGNAGETFLFEGAGFQWHGQPATVEPAGFTVPGAGWKPGNLKSSFAVVVNGRGLGEYVRIADNTDTRVTLERPWPVLPAGDVRLTVMRGVVENVFSNNREVDCDNSIMFYGAGIINNRIVRNRSENGLGITVWSWGEEKTNVLIPDYFNLFQNNALEDQGSFWMTVLGDIQQKVGVRNLGNLYRGNFLSDVRRKRENQYDAVWEQGKWGMYRPIQSAFWLDIGRSYSSDRTQTPVWVDTLIERNYVTRCDWGVELRKIAGGTVVRQNTFFDVKTPIIDQGAGTALLDNRIEQPVYDSPPPPAEVDRP